LTEDDTGTGIGRRGGRREEKGERENGRLDIAKSK
jgi:hypothetical protein